MYCFVIEVLMGGQGGGVCCFVIEVLMSGGGCQKVIGVL